MTMKEDSLWKGRYSLTSDSGSKLRVESVHPSDESKTAIFDIQLNEKSMIFTREVIQPVSMELSPA